MSRRVYPYQQPDGHWIIGPMCFSDPDKTVINWQGDNYYARAESAEAAIMRVRELAHNALLPSAAPLGTVLYSLSRLAGEQGDPREHLARIVAVAEREVGDGWKADPDEWDRDWDDHVDIWIMLDALCVTEQKWQAVGDRSAAWLRSLLDGAA